MWVYLQKSGSLYHNDVHVADGYSGFSRGKNNPSMQHVPGIGPIPQGAYLIGAESEDEKHGPVALHLVPLTGTETWQRTGFLVHGDSKSAPGAASHGCIIVPRLIRDHMADQNDKLLIVLSGNILH
jgi:hypothetical protein